jgi:hypothetical protein
MLRRIGIPFVVVALLLPSGLLAQKGRVSSSRSRSSSKQSTNTHSTSAKPKNPSIKSRPSRTSSVPRKSTVAPRSSNGKIQRSASARNEFMRQSGYPKGRKGYVVDHIVPLECGGADVPSNMQWQTVAEAQIKGRTERNCRRE